MVEQSMARLILFTVIPIQIGKAQEGISMIPPEQLYENVDIEDLKCLKNRLSIKQCAEKSEFHTDYACRYDSNVRRRCYCCGANYKYIEYGGICTRFCLTKRPSSPKYGKYPIIILPFNWGDAGKPDSASLEDGSDYPIIPLNANLSRLIYGFETYEENSGGRVSINIGKDLEAALPYFTKSMFLELAKEKKNENLLFSPISLHSVLALLSAGSNRDSKTKEELGNALGLTRNPKILKDEYRRLIRFMRDQKEILYSNEIFLSSSMSANSDYANEAYKHFGTNISYFMEDHIKNSQKEINTLIAERTNGRVKEAIDELDSNTKLLMINTLFFKGKWAVPFEDSKRITSFKTPSGEKQVNMMEVFSEGIRIKKLNVGRGSSQTIEIIQVPKIDKNNKTSNYELRIAMAPEQFGEKGMEVLIDLMTQDENSNIFLETNGEVLIGEVSLTLPKFSMRSKLDVSDYLKNIGVKALFTEAAELTEIANGPDNLSVTRILQEVVMNVDTEGSEAAVATIAQITTYSAEDPLIRRVDRPFVFMLWDKVNSIPLIVGMVNDPTESS